MFVLKTNMNAYVVGYLLDEYAPSWQENFNIVFCPSNNMFNIQPSYIY